MIKMKQTYIVFLIILCLVGGLMVKQNKQVDKISVAITIPWRTLHPGLQHTLAGDLILSNQFDALVGIGELGELVPLGAKSWSFNDNFTQFQFQIDHSKLFEDGSELTSFDYKKSWENALQLESKSANNSLLDFLYKIDGFEDFQTNKQIIGIQTPDRSTLIIKFKTPFRMALDFLTGNRFSAFKTNDDGRIVGTGKFSIQEISETVVHLTPRDPEKYSTYEINFIEPSELKSAIQDKKFDLYPFLGGSLVAESHVDPSLYQLHAGQDTLHVTVMMNRLHNRVFSQSNHRKALLYLFYKRDSLLKNFYSKTYFDWDFQSFLLNQAGRLDPKIVDEMILSYEPLVKKLIEATKKSPLVVVTPDREQKIIRDLKSFGLTLSEQSRVIENKEYLDIIYKNHTVDIIPSSFSISNGDPDGIYHRLGKNGAILSPMIYSESVGRLLEDGRKIVDISLLDNYYQKVTRAILEDVPYVHLGFSKAVALYKRDQIQMNKDYLRRNQGHLDIFTGK